MEKWLSARLNFLINDVAKGMVNANELAQVADSGVRMAQAAGNEEEAQLWSEFGADMVLTLTQARDAYLSAMARINSDIAVVPGSALPKQKE